MKVTASLNHFNDSGLMATIQSDHEWEEEVCIVQVGWNAKPKQVCIRAAKICRKMAERFERLATEENPCNQETIKRINSP